MMQIVKQFSKDHRFWLRVGIISFLILLGLFLYKYVPLVREMWRFGTDPLLLEQAFRHPTVVDILLLLLLTALMTAIPFMSSSVIALVNGVILGPVFGFALNWIGALLGNLLVALVIAHTDLANTSHRTDKHTQWLSHFKNHFLSLTLGYMLPFVPSFLVNDRAVVWKIPKKQVVLAILLGTAPSNLLYAFGGNALFKWQFNDLLYLAIALLVLLGIYVIIKRVTGKKEKHVT